MVERDGVGVKMKDDEEELEMLLDEIPHATSFNLNHLHSNGCDGSYVRRKLYDHTCSVSPLRGVLVKSDGSGGGSPAPPPMEELKPSVVSDHFKGLQINHGIGGMRADGNGNGNGNTFSDLNLGKNFSSRLYISGEQESGSKTSFSDRGVRMVPEKFRGIGDQKMGVSDYRGFVSSAPVPQNPIGVNSQVGSPMPVGLSYDCGFGNLYATQYLSGLSNGLVSQLNPNSSAMDSQLYQTKVLAGHLYHVGIPLSDLPGSVMWNVSHAPQNGRSIAGEFPFVPHRKSHIDAENAFYSHQHLSNGRGNVTQSARMPQGNIEAFARDDSLIVQGESLSCTEKNARPLSIGHDKARPQEKRSQQLYGSPKSKGIQESGRSSGLYLPFSLPLKLSSLREVQGYISHMAKDQYGCRFLQRIFDEGTPRDVQIIYDEIIDHAVELMMNPFGNYLMQKLLEVCNEEQRTQILLRVTEDPGQLVSISLNTHGTRVVQKLIETLKTRQQILILISSLEPGFLDLIKDLNGNHVVQRCLQCFSNEDSKFIFVTAAKYCVDIATHQHGCCVLQRCITHATGEYQENLVAEISANGLLLAQDAFGNYVVQFILELKIPSATSKLISQFEGNFVHLSTQKFSSHVVEKCLITCDVEVQSKIIRELVSATHFEQLLQDPHANYVIQTALRVSEDCLHKLLVDAIESHKSISRNSPYSKRIFSNKLWKK
ncbi:PREDICTED: putative pumilio homolog 7, chloroplastic [Ipomoea nil]|uniref:putative pumilio homolog 7, chloroplastic n=1 Tax=Ipomoea nil TaxID=35883 RepID=UPI0009018035|nr:PREDICTED: putative pumilio homolog 7, chloroplastic [Ipomoea nil]